MTLFYVVEYEPKAFDGNEDDACQLECHSATEAAQTYMELHHGDMDYADECELWVWSAGEKPKKFNVIAEQSWDYYATEDKPKAKS